MMRYGLAYLSTAVVFAVMDFAWLSFANERIYRAEIGSLLADKVRIGPAIAFYVIYIAGVVVFAVAPALKGGGVQAAIIQGGLFGLVAYATYDLTNMATLKVWSTKVTLLDLAWGMFATAVAATAATLITRALVKG